MSMGRPIEWLAVTTVVGVGLAAAFYLAPSGAAPPNAAAMSPGPAELAEPQEAPAAIPGDRLMVVRERRSASAPQAEAAPQPQAAAPSYAPQSGKPAALAANRPRLKPTQPVVGLGAYEHSSAFISNAPVAEAPAPAAEPSSRSAIAASHTAMAQASPVRYGVSDRSEIMARGAGPVYNFRGRAVRGASAAPARASSTAAPQVDSDAASDDE